MAGQSLDDLIAGARTAKRAHRDVDVTLDQAVAEQIEAIDLRLVEVETESLDLREELVGALDELKADARLGDTRQAETKADYEGRIAALRERAEALVEERAQVADGTLITLRFTQIPGQAWAELGARNPARADVTIDRVYGYNYHEVAKGAAIFHDEGARPGTVGRGYVDRVLPADGDAEPSVEPVTVEQLTGIFEILSGHEFERIASAIWDLNDYSPQQRIAAAGKASRAGSVSRSS